VGLAENLGTWNSPSWWGLVCASHSLVILEHPWNLKTDTANLWTLDRHSVPSVTLLTPIGLTRCRRYDRRCYIRKLLRTVDLMASRRYHYRHYDTQYTIWHHTLEIQVLRIGRTKYQVLRLNSSMKHCTWKTTRQIGLLREPRAQFRSFLPAIIVTL